jgi:hypothetical protein
MYLEEWSEHGSDKYRERWRRGGWVAVRSKFMTDGQFDIWLYRPEWIGRRRMSFHNERMAYRTMIGYMCEYASDPLV